MRPARFGTAPRIDPASARGPEVLAVGATGEVEIHLPEGARRSVAVATERDALVFSPEANGSELVKLTDGGALSNSGLWSLVNLLLDESSFGKLRKRGVLLFIIEASKMPNYRSIENSFNSLLGTIGDQAPIGRNLHNHMLDLLEERYGDRLVAVQIDLVPRESLNIMTTWALDRRSLRSLKKESFERRWREEKADLQRKWTS